MSTITFHVGAILFDMDGTLIDSTAGVVGAWDLFRETYTDIDIQNILSTSHGVRTADNLRKHCKVEDPDELEREVKRFEKAIVTTSTMRGGLGIVQLPGVPTILKELAAAARHSSHPLWAICTSASRGYASSALQIAGVPFPHVFVVAEDVTQGKPFPDPYLLGAKLCGVKPEYCVVFEDAPSGVLSGRTAGCKTIGLLTTHNREAMEACQPDFLVRDLSRVSVKVRDHDIEIAVNID